MPLRSFVHPECPKCWRRHRHAHLFCPECRTLQVASRARLLIVVVAIPLLILALSPLLRPMMRSASPVGGVHVDRDTMDMHGA